jgi:ubiquinone/menaquinone biosynthesis C-methylase UbiE
MKNGPAPYDKQANSYDRTWRRYIARTLGFLKASIPFHSTDKILDIACGTGEFERLVLREHPDQQMIGIDISENMLNLARQKCCGYPSAIFLKADASALPFPDQTFDLVVSANSLHYFDDPSVSLAEMRRVLLSTGSLVILDWCKDYLIGRCFDFVFRRIERGYQSCYTRCELQRLLGVAGFAIQSTRKIKLGSIFWGHMIAIATPKA